MRDRLVADHHLHDAGGLAQVDEGDAAVVASPGHPPGEGHGLSDVLGAQAACVVGADHWFCSSLSVLLVVPVETTCGRRSSAGGSHVSGSASTWSPLRMSLTWWPPSSVAGNQTYGMPRRSAYRICLPNFWAAGGDLGRDAAGPEPLGDGVARVAGRLVVERDQDGGRHGPAAVEQAAAEQGYDGPGDAEGDPDPGVGRPAVGGQRVVATAAADRLEVLEAVHVDLEDRAGVVVQPAGEAEARDDLEPVAVHRRRSPRPRRSARRARCPAARR